MEPATLESNEMMLKFNSFYRKWLADTRMRDDVNTRIMYWTMVLGVIEEYHNEDVKPFLRERVNLMLISLRQMWLKLLIERH